MNLLNLQLQASENKLAKKVVKSLSTQSLEGSLESNIEKNSQLIKENRVELLAGFRKARGIIEAFEKQPK